MNHIASLIKASPVEILSDRIEYKLDNQLCLLLRYASDRGCIASVLIVDEKAKYTKSIFQMAFQVIPEPEDAVWTLITKTFDAIAQQPINFCLEYGVPISEKDESYWRSRLTGAISKDEFKKILAIGIYCGRLLKMTWRESILYNLSVEQAYVLGKKHSTSRNELQELFERIDNSILSAQALA